MMFLGLCVWGRTVPIHAQFEGRIEGGGAGCFCARVNF